VDPRGRAEAKPPERRSEWPYPGGSVHSYRAFTLSSHLGGVMADTARSIMIEAQRRREDRRSDPRLHGITGSYRFDVEGAGSWRLEVRDETVAITESPAPADCVIRCDEADFIPIARGEQNLLTAAMQGRVQVEGDYALAQRLHGFIRVTRKQPA
jgi:hypothetical protein